MRLTNDISQTLTNVANALPKAVGNTTNSVASTSPDATDDTALEASISTCHHEARGGFVGLVMTYHRSSDGIA